MATATVKTRPGALRVEFTRVPDRLTSKLGRRTIAELTSTLATVR